MSEHDTAYKILKAALEKYGLEKERVENFVLVEVLFPSGEGGALSRFFSDMKTTGQYRERCLLDDECPLVSLSEHMLRKDVDVVFALRLRPSNFPPQYRNNQSPVRMQNNNGPLFDESTRCGADPVLLSITKGLQCAPFVLQKGPNEVGSDFSISGLMVIMFKLQIISCSVEISSHPASTLCLEFLR